MTDLHESIGYLATVKWLGLLAAFLWYWMASCLFGLHIITSPRNQIWEDWPPRLRLSILAAATGMLVRAIAFNITKGQINPAGLVVMALLAWMMTEFACWILDRKLPADWMKRVGWTRGPMERNADAVTILVERSELTEIAIAAGMAAVPPGGGTEEFLAAVRRSPPYH